MLTYNASFGIDFARVNSREWLQLPSVEAEEAPDNCIRITGGVIYIKVEGAWVPYAPVTNATNGLYVTEGEVKWGGDLIEHTEIYTGGNRILFEQDTYRFIDFIPVGESAGITMMMGNGDISEGSDNSYSQIAVKPLLIQVAARDSENNGPELNLDTSEGVKLGSYLDDTFKGLTISVESGSAFNNPVTAFLDGIGTERVDGVRLINSTLATSDTYQNSPSLTWEGSSWRTVAGGSSNAVTFFSYVKGQVGGQASYGHWILGYKNGLNSAETEIIKVSPTGNIWFRSAGVFGESTTESPLITPNATIDIRGNVSGGAYIKAIGDGGNANNKSLIDVEGNFWQDVNVYNGFLINITTLGESPNTDTTFTKFAVGGSDIRFRVGIDGTIRSKALAGIGTRSIGADTNGNIIAYEGGSTSNIYTEDGTISSLRTVDMDEYSVNWINSGLFRIQEGDSTVGGVYDFNEGVDFSVFNETDTVSIISNLVSGIRLSWDSTDQSNSLIVGTTGILLNGEAQLNDGDLEFGTVEKGVILKAPDGTRYRILVDNAGILTTAVVV